MIVGLSGYAGTGKDEVGRILVEVHGFQRWAKGDLIKSVARRCGWDGSKDARGRWFLQELADSVVDELGCDVWTDELWRRIGRANPANVVLTRLSLPAEAHAVKARGGHVVRVRRPGFGPVNNHPNETALDGWDFDAVIDNSGTLGDLHRAVRLCLSELSGLATVLPFPSKSA